MIQTIYFFTSFIICSIFIYFSLPFLKKLQFGQSIREDGPKSHIVKQGTPTMGGVFFLLSLLICLVIFQPFSFQTLFVTILTLGYGLIGFLDDGLKVYFKRNLGLTAKQKLLCQFVLSIVAYILLVNHGFDTKLYIPGTSLSFELQHFYLLFMIFLILGTTNAVNLTDGLDGLATGTSILAFSAYAYILWHLNFIDLYYFVVILIGTLVAFLLFNKNPAKIFMGDTGSLALGGALVGCAIITKTEILLAILGGIFVIETLSVIIQVLFFKTKKRRIFKMTPLHHHFELSGWSESKVVLTFWTWQFVFAFFALLIFI